LEAGRLLKMRLGFLGDVQGFEMVSGADNDGGLMSLFQRASSSGRANSTATCWAAISSRISLTRRSGRDTPVDLDGQIMAAAWQPPGGLSSQQSQLLNEQLLMQKTAEAVRESA
jgi:hypothetical protein